METGPGVQNWLGDRLSRTRVSGINSERKQLSTLEGPSHDRGFWDSVSAHEEDSSMSLWASPWGADMMLAPSEVSAAAGAIMVFTFSPAEIWGKPPSPQFRPRENSFAVSHSYSVHTSGRVS